MSLSEHERRVIDELERHFEPARRSNRRRPRIVEVARWTAVALVITLIVQVSLDSPGAGLAVTVGLVVVMASVRIHIRDAARNPSAPRAG